VQTEVREAGPFEQMLVVHLDEAELEDAKDKAARKLSRELKIKGFRPGKAPRAVVERMVGAPTLRKEAIDEALPDVIGKAIVDNELQPVVTPRLEDVRDGDDGSVELEVRITRWPTADGVPDYEGRKIAIEVPDVEQQELDDQVDRFRNQFAELETVDRAGDEGDFTMVNITALIDGGVIEDASANDLLYEIGSQSFIPGLDALLVGASAGDIREGPATLPPGFGDHGGQDVSLRVLVKEIRAKRLPEVTDEWVSDVSEFDTVDEFTEAITESLQGMKLGYAANAFQERLLEELAEETEIELPDALIESEMESSLHNLQHSLEQQGLDLANYLRITGQDQQAFVDELREGATRSLRTRILLEAVAEAENLEVDDTEYASAIESLAQQTEQSTESVRQALEASGQDAVLTGDILRRKALDRLLAAATPVDGDGNVVDLTPPQRDQDESEPNSEVEESAGDEEAPLAANNVEESDAETDEQG
jgi:trigger factor